MKLRASSDALFTLKGSDNMYEINCYDSYGNTIDYLTQWDYNRKLIMYIDNYDLSYAPEVHFCNQNSVEALVVQSVVEGNKLTVDIPNILLQEHLALYAYVYLSDANNAASQKTILSVAIPVRYKPKPSDYTYIENIDKVTAATIEQSVYDKVRTSIRDVVFEYLDDNPVTGGATPEQAQQIETNTANVSQLSGTVNSMLNSLKSDSQLYEFYGVDRNEYPYMVVSHVFSTAPSGNYTLSIAFSKTIRLVAPTLSYVMEEVLYRSFNVGSTNLIPDFSNYAEMFSVLTGTIKRSNIGNGKEFQFYFSNNESRISEYYTNFDIPYGNAPIYKLAVAPDIGQIVDDVSNLQDTIVNASIKEGTERELTTDKTFEEVLSAIADGKRVLFKINDIGIELPFVWKVDNILLFSSSVAMYEDEILTINVVGAVWYSNGYCFLTAGEIPTKEYVDNESGTATSLTKEAIVEALGYTPVSTSDIVDDVLNGNSDQVLSAYQGYILDSKITQLKKYADKKIGTEMIVDNLESGYTNYVLSAKQGAVLKGMIDDLSATINNLPSGGSGLTQAQIAALDGMFKKCEFTGDATAEYTAFKQAFGIES